MFKHLDKYIEYLIKAGDGQVSIAHFDDDWKPVGETVRLALRSHGLAEEAEGNIKLIPRIRFDGMVNIIKDKIKGVDDDDILIESLREFQAGTLFEDEHKNE